MNSITVTELVDLADCMAQDLLGLAQLKQIPEKDLLMAVAMAQKIIQKEFYNDDLATINGVLLEAAATYQAMSEALEAN